MEKEGDLDILGKLPSVLCFVNCDNISSAQGCRIGHFGSDVDVVYLSHDLCGKVVLSDMFFLRKTYKNSF